MTSKRPAVFLLALACFSLCMLGPVVALLASVSPVAALTAFAQPGARDALAVSLLASTLAVLAASVLGIPAGYEIAHWGDRTRSVALFCLALPLAFPPVASGILLLSVLGRNAPLGAWLASRGIAPVDSLAGVAIAEFFVAGSFVVITACAAFHSLDPTYEESAATLGASPARRFWRIALPLAAPNVAAGVILAWLRAIGEYGATSILAYHPASLPIALSIVLSASGIAPALALTYGFVALSALVVGVQWAIRRHVV